MGERLFGTSTPAGGTTVNAFTWDWMDDGVRH